MFLGQISPDWPVRVLQGHEHLADQDGDGGMILTPIKNDWKKGKEAFLHIIYIG